MDTSVLDAPPDVGAMTDSQLTEHVQKLETLRDQVEAARLAALGAWDSRAVWALDAAPNGACWIAAQGRVSRASAGSTLRTARRLRDMPHTSAALAAGTLAPAKAHLLAGVLNERTAERFAHDEEMLVAGARELSVDQTAQLLKYWSLNFDTNGADPRDRDANTAFLSRTLGGRYHLNSNLDTEGGSILDAALDKIINEWRHAARATRDGSLPPAAQLRAHALVELAIRSTAAGERPATKPLLWVLAPQDNLHSGEGTAEIGGVGPVPVTMAQRLRCDADISQITLDENRKPVNLGRTSRLATAAQRRMLIFMLNTCSWPGCERPGHACEAHHIIWWEHGGPTDIQNLALLCRYHHHACHEGGFRLERNANGDLVFYRPDGTTLTAPTIAA